MAAARSTSYDPSFPAMGGGMKKRSKAGARPAKARPRKMLKRKGHNVPKPYHSSSSANELTRLTRERDEALEQQAATAEVLKVISRSTFHLQTVLDTLAESAARLCGAERAFIFRPKDGSFHFAAGYGYSQQFREFLAQAPLPLGRGSIVGRAALEKKVVEIKDTKADPEFAFVRPPNLRPSRSMLGVPLIRDGTLIGVMGFATVVVKSFNAKEIELATTFANQAIIAIENVRLLTELRQRTTDLTESLEQQTATSEVLQVISSSPGDLEPVFATMLQKAVRICEAKFGNIYRVEADGLRNVATYNTPADFAKRLRSSSYFSPSPKNPVRHMMQTKAVVHVVDAAATEAYAEHEPIVVASVELGGTRTLVIVPMLKDNELVGAFTLARQEVRPFTEKQIALVTNFAAQAVIAIENARLLNELRESLQEQTATSEVLRVISSSPGDLEPVFSAMLEKAVRICDATFGNIYRWDSDALQLVATQNTPPAYAEHRRRSPFRADQNNSVARMITSKKVVHLLDAATNETYATRRDPTVVAAVELGGIRTALIVPMLKDDELVGAFIVSRQEVRPFTEKQIALVTNFAAQAVIAIENARLLQELRQRTDEVEKLNQHLEQRVTDQVGEIDRMGRLRRFLPPQVADLIVASGTEKQLESHRREITALFCDLRGFTGFTEVADAEDVMALLRDYHSAIGEIIIKYSGTLERYAGDGVMVIFNDPVPIENPALQAVLMALEMRDAIETLTEKWRQLGHEIGFGIGIAHGYATLGTIGFEGRFDYAAIGTVSNVASRLCDEAKPGQILISPRVLMAVKDAVAVEAIGEFELKGIRRPIAAYNVLATAPPNA
jgi:GAF domain-containing protein